MISIGAKPVIPTCGIPQAIADLQVAARSNNEDAYWRFSRHINDDNTRNANLRGLLEFNKSANAGPVPLDEVEAEAEIVKAVLPPAL